MIQCHARRSRCRVHTFTTTASLPVALAKKWSSPDSDGMLRLPRKRSPFNESSPYFGHLVHMSSIRRSHWTGLNEEQHYSDCRAGEDGARWLGAHARGGGEGIRDLHPQHPSA